MSESLLLWLLFSVIPKLGTISVIVSFIATLVVGITFLVKYLNDNSDEALIKMTTIFKVFIPILCVSLFLTVMLPTKKDIAFIAGGYATVKSAQYLMNSEEANKLPDNVLKVANKFLENVGEKANEQ